MTTTRAMARPMGLCTTKSLASATRPRALVAPSPRPTRSILPRFSGDWNLIHTDVEYSKGYMFGWRVAHGLLILSVASGLAVRLGFLEGTTLAFRGLEWKMQRPVFIGDTIRVRLTVESGKAMARLGGGLVNFKIEVLNQNDEVCQRGNWEMLVKSLEA